MDAFSGPNDFLFITDDTEMSMSQLPESSLALSFEQSAYSSAWSQHAMPVSPFYDQVMALPLQSPIQDQYHHTQHDAADMTQLMRSGAPSSAVMSQADYSPQHLLSEHFSAVPLAPSSSGQHARSDTGHEQDESLNFLTEAEATQTGSHGEDGFSWSASSSPSSSGAAERSKRDSWPRDAPAMQKKSSATQCELCDKWVVDMKKHRESHEETRTAKCPLAVCAYTAKGMSRTNDIKRHVVAQHWTQGLFCVFCPGARGEPGLHFEKAQAFRTHMRNVHAVQNRGTRDALKMPEALKPDGSHGHCQVCQQEMKNYQHLHDHLESCIRRQLVISQDVSETNARNLADVPSPQLSPVAAAATSESSLRQPNISRPHRQLKRHSTRDHALPLHESINAGNIGSGDGIQYPSSWQDLADDFTVMHRSITTYDGPEMMHRESMLYKV